ncbi:lipopolysaccharide heptosyltransferase II [Persephonella sp.]
MRIVIWQTAFLGDLILTTPLIRSLKNIFPESEVTLISKSFGREVFKDNPYLDELIVFDKKRMSTLSLIKKLRKKQFDMAISPHRSHRASYSLFLAGIKRRIGFDKAGFSFLYTETVPHRFDGIHEIDRNLSLLKVLDEYDEKKIYRFPEIFLNSDEDSFFEKFNLKNKEYILVAPGSKWETKRWTVEGFTAVVENLLKNGETVVLFGGNEDREITAKMLTNLRSDKKLLDLVGKTTLRESFSIVKHAKALVSNDSAPVHMAVAFNIPVVDIYGPTVTSFGFYPYRNGVVVETEGLSCRPCGLHGHRKCPTGTFECMKNISPKMVLNALEKVL